MGCNRCIILVIAASEHTEKALTGEDRAAQGFVNMFERTRELEAAGLRKGKQAVVCNKGLSGGWEDIFLRTVEGRLLPLRRPDQERRWSICLWAHGSVFERLRSDGTDGSEKGLMMMAGSVR